MQQIYTHLVFSTHVHTQWSDPNPGRCGTQTQATNINHTLQPHHIMFNVHPLAAHIKKQENLRTTTHHQSKFIQVAAGGVVLPAAGPCPPCASSSLLHISSISSGTRRQYGQHSTLALAI